MEREREWYWERKLLEGKPPEVAEMLKTAINQAPILPFIEMETRRLFNLASECQLEELLHSLAAFETYRSSFEKQIVDYTKRRKMPEWQYEFRKYHEEAYMEFIKDIKNEILKGCRCLR